MGGNFCINCPTTVLLSLYESGSSCNGRDYKLANVRKAMILLLDFRTFSFVKEK